MAIKEFASLAHDLPQPHVQQQQEKQLRPRTAGEALEATSIGSNRSSSGSSNGSSSGSSNHSSNRRATRKVCALILAGGWDKHRTKILEQRLTSGGVVVWRGVIPFNII